AGGTTGAAASEPVIAVAAAPVVPPAMPEPVAEPEPKPESPSKPEPEADPKAIDPFSVDAIEAEFARLLGRDPQAKS
ncbi:MAG: hypothetical protein ACT6UR_22190, partial [Bosea sp. (in: a-proteobacteria)]